MTINVYPNTKVYVIAPANVATGGPELLHQLVYHLRNDLNIDAYMYYIPEDHPNPIHFAYQRYKNPFVRNIEDEHKHILISPEVISGLEVLKKYKNIRKIIWWLSVDNFFISSVLKDKKRFFIKRVINKITDKAFNTLIFDVDDLIIKKVNFSSIDESDLIRSSDFHLCQSYYALNFLSEIGIPNNKFAYLSDYLNEDFLKIKTDLTKKEDIVVYNPKKGLSLTKKIIKSSQNITFIPIIGMSRKEVIKLLQRAKVYIDFGNHPGKDRIPREAAVLGCCIIVGKEGSAKYFEDVPIPEKYKFDRSPDEIPKIIDTINSCLKDYDVCQKDFVDYVNKIKQEKSRFVSDLKKIFKKTN